MDERAREVVNKDSMEVGQVVDAPDSKLLDLGLRRAGQEKGEVLDGEIVPRSYGPHGQTMIFELALNINLTIVLDGLTHRLKGPRVLATQISGSNARGSWGFAPWI